MARSLSQKTLILAAGMGIQSVLTQVVVNLFLVRLMNQESFGIYRQVWLVIYTAIAVFSFGLDTSIFYFLPNLAVDQRRAFLARTMGLLLLSGILLALAIRLASPYIAAGFSAPEVASQLRSLDLYVLFIMPCGVLFPFLIASDRSELAIFYNILFLAVQAGITVVMVAQGYELTTVFHVLGIFSAIRCLQSLVEVARLTHGRWSARIPLGVGAHLRYALPVGITATVAMVGGRLDKFVVASSLNPAAYALYSVGALEFPLVVLLCSAVATVIRMQVSRLHHSGNIQEISALYASAFRKLCLTLIPLGIWLALFAKEIIVLLYTSDYVSATTVFQVYLLLILFRLGPLEPILASLGMTRILFLGGLGFLGVDLALNLALVRMLGMLGPPLATVLATAALWMFYGHHVARRLGIPMRRLFAARTAGRIIALAGASALVALPIKTLGWSPAILLACGSLLFGAAFLALGLSTRTLHRNDFQVFGGFYTMIEQQGQRWTGKAK